MKVLYFHQHFVTPKGAGAVRSYAMAKKLIALGHSVTMVCGSMGGGNTGLDGSFVRGSRRGNVDGIDVIEFDLGYSNKDGFAKRTVTFLKFALRSIHVALFEKSDLVFATTTPLTAGIPGILSRWLLRKPFVFEVRDLWPELPKAMKVITNPLILLGMNWLEWISYRSADRLIGLAPGIVDGIAGRGVARERIDLVPNGCDLDIFEGTTQPWRPAGVRDTDLLAIYAGTHGVANGLDAVLDAAAELKSQGRDDIKFVLIGQGKLKESLQKRAAEQSLTNVLFLDSVIKSELAGLMASADVGMQVLANVPAFYYGTSPNKFFDYLSAGLPVLNNYPGWLAELIQKNQCGYTVEPNDPKAFAAALVHALAHRAELKVMGQNARDLAKSQFHRDDLSEQWVTSLEKAAVQYKSKRYSRGILKRMVDLVLAVSGLAVLWPLMLLLCVLVRVFLGSPILFSQTRVGQGTKRFKLYKFRTMTDARDKNGELLPDNVRLTSFGKFLRKTSLDELPQLWNVVKGDLSLIGPRPLLIEYLPLYSETQSRRHEVRPGISGWAQVNGRNAISWKQKFDFDVWYVDNASFWLDLKIIWLTLKRVLGMSGVNQDGSATMEKFTGNEE